MRMRIASSARSSAMRICCSSSRRFSRSFRLRFVRSARTRSGRTRFAEAASVAEKDNGASTDTAPIELDLLERLHAAQPLSNRLTAEYLEHYGLLPLEVNE